MVKKKTTTKTEVAKVTQYSADKIPAMLDDVNAQIKKLTGSGAKKASTLGVAYPGLSEVASINKLDDLIILSATITTKEKAYNQEIINLKLSIKTPAFTIAGFSANVWREDIAMRIQEVAFQSQLERLNRIKSTLEENLSADQKLANDMLKIQAELNEM